MVRGSQLRQPCLWSAVHSKQPVQGHSVWSSTRNEIGIFSCTYVRFLKLFCISRNRNTTRNSTYEQKKTFLLVYYGGYAARIFVSDSQKISISKFFLLMRHQVILGPPLTLVRSTVSFGVPSLGSEYLGTAWPNEQDQAETKVETMAEDHHGVGPVPTDIDDDEPITTTPAAENHWKYHIESVTYDPGLRRSSCHTAGELPGRYGVWCSNGQQFHEG